MAAAAAAGGGALLLGGCSSRLGLPNPAADTGDDVVMLWRVLFWTAVAIGGLVLVLLAWVVVRYRERARRELSQRHEHVALEIFYTAVPLAIVAGLFGLGLVVDNRVQAIEERPDLVVEVVGFQWQWSFHYPEAGVTVTGTPEDDPVLVLPADRATRLELTSSDVIHSFFVPGFLRKVDVIPGRVVEYDIRPVRTGTFGGHCAEYCGFAHAAMNFEVLVLSPDDFDEWLAEQEPSP